MGDRYPAHLGDTFAALLILPSEQEGTWVTLQPGQWVTGIRLTWVTSSRLWSFYPRNGVVMQRHEGTPQGGPLSPLLANVLLDEVDKELEKRGHAFVRYADDRNVYVKSRRAGEDIMETLRRLYAKLRLRINESKSAVARPWGRKFLGYSFWVAKGRQVNGVLQVNPLTR